MNALNQHNDLKDEIIKYDAFTDIEFNPKNQSIVKLDRQHYMFGFLEIIC